MFATIGLSLCGAFMNALAAIMQRRETSGFQRADLLTKHLAQTLIKNRKWLIGMAIQVGAFFFQAAALHYGVLSTVEPVMTTDLLFILAILLLHFRVPIGKREWGGGVAIIIGLSGMLLAANPRSGFISLSPFGLILMVAVIGLLMVVGALQARNIKNAMWRAALLGVATGAGFALTAAFTKIAVQGFSADGFGVLLTYQPYALLLAGLSSLFLAQSTYGAGPLVASQPALMITDPVVSVVIGVLLFGDEISHSVGTLAAMAAGAAIAAAGIWLLSGSPLISTTEHLQ